MPTDGNGYSILILQVRQPQEIISWNRKVPAIQKKKV